MKINPTFYGIYIIICVFLTFSAYAQETEDVVYLVDGSISGAVIGVSVGLLRRGVGR